MSEPGQVVMARSLAAAWNGLATMRQALADAHGERS